MKAEHILTVYTRDAVVRIEADSVEALEAVSSRLQRLPTDADDTCGGEVYIELEA